MAQSMKITLHHGVCGANHAQRESVRTLGLRKIGQTVERPDNPAVRGLVNVVRHLVTVEEVD